MVGGQANGPPRSRAKGNVMGIGLDGTEHDHRRDGGVPQGGGVRFPREAGVPAERFVLRRVRVGCTGRGLLATMAALLLGIGAAQQGATFSGAVADWAHGEGDLVMHSSAHGQPPAELADDQRVLGRVEADGSFSFELPTELPDDELVPIDTGIGDCSDLTADPEGVRFYPLDVIVYEDGVLAGLLFPVSPGGGQGPVVPGYSVLMGYTNRAVTVRGSCVNEARRVEEAYDATVEQGWHLLVQRFDEHPTRDGWRIDRWRAEPMPEDVEWVLLIPPF